MKVQCKQCDVRPQVSWDNMLTAESLRSINKNSCYVKLCLIDTLPRADWARVTMSRTFIAASKLTSNKRGCPVASTHSHWVIERQLKCCERLLLPMNGQPIEEVASPTESGTSVPSLICLTRNVATKNSEDDSDLQTGCKWTEVCTQSGSDGVLDCTSRSMFDGNTKKVHQRTTHRTPAHLQICWTAIPENYLASQDRTRRPRMW